jgi:excisionase family DNA binding protein
LINEDVLYSPNQVAAVLRISSGTVRREIRKGSLRAFRAGGQWRILGSDLVKYLNQRTGVALNTPSNEGVST